MATTTAVKYEYQVRDRAGKTINGALEAPNERVVAAKLREMGYAPVSITRSKESALQKEITIPGFAKKVKTEDLAVFSRQFATMINSGVSLIRALNILAEQTENEKLAEIIKEVRSDVEEGQSLSESIAKHPDTFPKLYVAMVRAGETAGMLDSVLLRVADTMETDVALRRKIKSALTYPVVVLIMALGLSAAMLVFIVPTFVGLFESLGGELPLPTKVMLVLSGLLRNFWYIVMFVPVLVWKGFEQARKKPEIRFQLDRIKL